MDVFVLLSDSANLFLYLLQHLISTYLIELKSIFQFICLAVPLRDFSTTIPFDFSNNGKKKSNTIIHIMTNGIKNHWSTVANNMKIHKIKITATAKNATRFLIGLLRVSLGIFAKVMKNITDGKIATNKLEILRIIVDRFGCIFPVKM